MCGTSLKNIDKYVSNLIENKSVLKLSLSHWASGYYADSRRFFTHFEGLVESLVEGLVN